MNKQLREQVLATLRARFGGARKIGSSQSLYEVGANKGRVYIRYSTIHADSRTFFGLRRDDLRQLEGRASFMCFLWDGQKEPLLIPFADYEEVFHTTEPATDGQYKVQVYLADAGTDLYVARAGRFNVDAHFGWAGFERAIRARPERVPDLTHAQVQTLLGAIGVAKNYDIWIPTHDRQTLDWSMCERFSCRDRLPHGYDPAGPVLQEIDVLWIQRGSSTIRALYEVEHSTPVYSGLLRFNDVHLVAPSVNRFAIVSNDARRSLFIKQLNRLTFRTSGLSNLCTFLEYGEVYDWHRRVRDVTDSGAGEGAL